MAGRAAVQNSTVRYGTHNMCNGNKQTNGVDVIDMGSSNMDALR